MSELLAILEFVATATLRVLPAFLASVGLGVGIRALALDRAIRRAFDGRAGLGVLVGTAVGAFSPFCSCTVIPVVSGLLLSGVPLAPVMAFWVASPTMDPEIFVLSVATLGWPLAVARLGAALLVSLAAGYATLALGRAGLLPADPLHRPETARPAGAATPALLTLRPLRGGSGAAPPAPRPSAWHARVPAWAAGLPWARMGRDMAVQSSRLGRWLVLAFALEALIVRHVPQAAIAATLGGQSPWAVPLAALVGVPLYLNNVSALPIVSGLLAQGMVPGAAIAFLIAGPVTTVPAMAAVWGIARRPIFALYLATALGGSIVSGGLVNALLP